LHISDNAAVATAALSLICKVAASTLHITGLALIIIMELYVDPDTWISRTWIEPCPEIDNCVLIRKAKVLEEKDRLFHPPHSLNSDIIKRDFIDPVQTEGDSDEKIKQKNNNICYFLSNPDCWNLHNDQL
jgi:hypothetical protein